jgi:ABC-type branched-subunit amino acid transport system substrate-binding protein
MNVLLSTSLPLLLVLLTTTNLIIILTTTTAIDVPIGVFDWQLYLDGTPWGEFGTALSVTVNYALAAQHFNERRIDIIPSLSRVKDCNKNISIVRICETSGDPAISVSDVLDMLRVENPVALAGFAGTPEAIHVSAVAAGWGNVPVISHWASGDVLTNRQESPTFVRTMTSDQDIAYTVVRFLVQLQYSVIGVVHLNEDSGPNIAESIKENLVSSWDGIKRYEVTVEGFTGQDQDSMDNTIGVMAAANLNVFVFVMYADDIPLLASSMQKYNLLNDKKFFLFCYLDRHPGEDEVLGNANMTALISGSFYIHNAIPIDSSIFNHYVNDLWPTFDSIVDTEIAPHLPPHGLRNSNWQCKNQNATIVNPGSDVYQGRFFHDTQHLAYEIWGQAYDAMLSLGFAICASDPTGSVVKRGIDLFDDLVQVEFEGMSGKVSFNPETGNRQLASVPIRARNWYIKDGKFIKDFVANFNATSDTWNFDNDSAVVLRGNVIGLSSAPIDFKFAVENKNYIPNELLALAYFETAFLLLLCVTSFIILFMFRKKRVILNSQPALMFFVVFGCLVATFSILTLSVDDNPDNPLQNVQAACASTPVIFALGFQISFCAILAKTWRIYSVFGSSNKLRRKTFGAGKAIRLLCIALLVEISLIIAWLTISPMRYERLIRFQDIRGDVLDSFGWCAADNISGAFGIVIAILHAFVIICGAVAARGVRAVPSEYGESKFIAYTVAALAQLYFLTVPTAVAVYTHVVGRFLILTSFAFFSILSILIFLVGTKVIVLYYGETDIWKEKATDTSDPTMGGGSSSFKLHSVRGTPSSAVGHLHNNSNNLTNPSPSPTTNNSRKKQQYRSSNNNNNNDDLVQSSAVVKDGDVHG